MSTTSSPVPPSSGRFDADAQGWFGGPEQGWGGRFMPEALIAALDELTEAWTGAMADPAFVGEFEHVLRDYAGLPSPLPGYMDPEKYEELLALVEDEAGPLEGVRP